MSTASVYFLGFAIGILLFFLPDRYGRKNTMLIISGPFIAAYFILTYIPQRELKALAFGIQGFLHIKTSLAYTHCQEFLCSRHKTISPTVITMFDSGSLLIFSFYLLLVSKNTYYIQTYYFWLGIVAFVIYIIWIPESPVYLFL
jgi:MFS family permease